MGSRVHANRNYFSSQLGVDLANNTDDPRRCSYHPSGLVESFIGGSLQAPPGLSRPIRPRLGIDDLQTMNKPHTVVEATPDSRRQQVLYMHDVGTWRRVAYRLHERGGPGHLPPWAVSRSDPVHKSGRTRHRWKGTKLITTQGRQVHGARHRRRSCPITRDANYVNSSA